MIKLLLLQWIIFSWLSTVVWGYAEGAPESTCLTMFPKHEGTESQDTPCPFTISVSPTSYTPSQLITVVVTGSSEKMFRGLQIRAHRVKGDTEIILGTFISFPDEKFKPLSCFGAANNMLSHKNGEEISNTTLTWKAPDSPVGDLIFTATIIASFSEFWYDQKSNVLTDPSSSTDLGLLEPVANVYPDMNFEGCGTTKGCVLYPRQCSGADCDTAISFRKDAGYVHFEMMGKAEGYVSVGFSDDRKMTNDETLSCTAQGSRVTIQRGYNPTLYNDRQYTVGLVNMTTVQKDAKVYCRFSRPLVMSVVSVKYPEGLPPQINNITFDLNHDWYIMLAWGYTYRDTDVMDHHAELPLITLEKVSLSSTMIYRGTSFNIYLQLHGCLAVVVWMFLVGLGTVIARHYREGFGAKMFCGKQAWFQLHRLFVVLTFLFTAASFILIFVSLQTWSYYAGAHIYLGIAIMAATLLQVFGGLIRPSPSSSIRPIFNKAHRLLGKATHIAAAVEIFLAFDIVLLPSGVRRFGTVVAIVWVAMQVAWELLLEIVSCCKSASSDKIDQYEVSNNFRLEEKQPEKTNGLANILFVLYALTITGVTVAALTAILLY